MFRMLRIVKRNVLWKCLNNSIFHKHLCSKRLQVFNRVVCVSVEMDVHFVKNAVPLGSHVSSLGDVEHVAPGCEQLSKEQTSGYRSDGSKSLTDLGEKRLKYYEDIKLLSCCDLYHTVPVAISSPINVFEYNRNTSSSGFRPQVVAVAALSFFGLFKKEEVDMGIVWIHQAQNAQEKLKFDEANKLYHDALHYLIEQRKSLKLEEKTFLERRTVIINGLANIALVTGRVREAEELFKDNMKGMLLCGMEQTDNAMVEVSLKLANVYARQKRDAEARAGYNFCIKSQEKKLSEIEEDNFSDTLALYGLSLDNYAKFLISRKDYVTAEKFLRKALKISQELSLLGEDIDHTTLIIQNNLATLLILRGDYEGAHEHLKRIVNLAEKSNFPELAIYYCNLGSVHLHQGHLDEAYVMCSKSKGLAQKLKDTQTELKAVECLKEIESRRATKS